MPLGQPVTAANHPVVFCEGAAVVLRGFLLRSVHH
jgi:hypothetical protein